jgi:predicted NAD/FAD-dependent oxidoreductase
MRDTRSDPCIALMLGFQDAPVPLLPFDAASVSGSDALAWVALDSSKPVGGGRVRCTTE